MTTKEEELIRISRDWDKAIEINDLKGMVQYMADDWVIVGTEGGIIPKERFLGVIRSGDLVHEKMEFEEIRVKIYDNTGIVTGRGISAGTFRGQPFRYHEWATSVFLRKSSSWQCVITMLTPALAE